MGIPRHRRSDTKNRVFGKVSFDDSKYDKGWFAKKLIKLKLWGKTSKIKVKAIAETSDKAITAVQEKAFIDFGKTISGRQATIQALLFDYYTKRNTDMAEFGSDGLKKSEAAMADLGKEIIPKCLFVFPETKCKDGTLVPAFCRLEVEQASYDGRCLYVNFYEKEPLVSEAPLDW